MNFGIYDVMVSPCHSVVDSNHYDCDCKETSSVFTKKLTDICEQLSVETGFPAPVNK